ncbi:molybdopterin-containing oxidoreductase family protein [Candidatus Leptofilum sp.]|uniref:molybdopterin-containing oxidoreductase family protein n=1 Tax=Candidatus Leptofilum sp. TaxID=3241576 RepID=UPI003B5BBFFD
MIVQSIRGACPHDCPDTCGFVTEVENGRPIKFYGDPDHPITQGWLCAKVRPYLDHVYHPDRLTHPLRRVGPKGSGQWERISWEAAISDIGNRWRDIISEHGAEAILPYSYSGTLGLLQMGVVNGRFWNRLGASQLERTICGAAAEFAVEATLGSRRSQKYEDVQHSKLVIIWGHNPVSTAPHFMPHLLRARKNGTQVIVIDPRRTRTAKLANWYIAPKPGSDGALALGIANHLVQLGLQDEAWLAANSVGWSAFKARLEEYPSVRVAAITGLPVEEITRLARLYAEATPALIKIADGLQRNFNGGQTVRAICALPAIMGQYGRRGGGLAYSTSGYLQWDSEAVGKGSECPPPGRSVNMNRLGAALLGEVSDPPIQSLFVYGSNPAAIAPNAGRVAAGMQREDLFTVVHELFMTDTADLADIVLPATSQLEHVDLHKGYGHTYLTYNQPAIPPLGESKSNWDVMCALAQEMGFDEPWLHQSADEVLAEVLSTTAANNPVLAGITLEKLKQAGTMPLTIEPDVPFADGRFPTPSGKVELYSQTMADMGLDPLPHWREVADSGGRDGTKLNGRFPSDQALTLISPASHHFTTSTFANQPDLLAREGKPFVEIHPDDAARQNIQTGDLVRLENSRGWCDLQAKVTDRVRRGVVASSKGRWSKWGNGRNINWLTSDALGDMAGQSTFHSSRVWLRRLD